MGERMGRIERDVSKVGYTFPADFADFSADFADFLKRNP
jgi:hypothetical protein